MPVLRRQHDHHRDLRARRQRPRTATLRLRKQDRNAMTANRPSPHAQSRRETCTVGGRMTMRACAHSASTSQPTTPKSPALQRPHRNATAPASLACPSTSIIPIASRNTAAAAADRRTSNPHRPETATLHPAGSFPGGFRTPAPAHVISTPASETLHRFCRLAAAGTRQLRQ